ncbi:DapH/DapD/GlmU-related protein [Roseovarius nanhaiticus]|uniref:DapH/DapD/GlmU-related protein n=1 Tax=Roseovarius nanhaiticus TaxID=573024 RepID=UPI0024936931|nr:DapH/DapD/GlmU-related protein [Roseovarius nanhaiticus]
MSLMQETEALLAASPEAAALIGISPRRFDGFADLAGAVLHAAADLPAGLVRRIYAAHPELAEISQHDIDETARRDFAPGGRAAALLFGRGVQAIMAHRVAHQLWQDGDRTLAMAIKARAGRAFSTDIHPAARVGPGLWLDHGLGFVVGETAMIGADVSIWHGVTLGSTLADSGARRHPTLRDGAVIGAGAILLGGITIGARANVAAGAIVTQDVAPGTLVAGAKAREIGPARISFAAPERNDV